MKFLFKSRHLGIAALIMGGSVLLSRFMGLIRDTVIGHFYGASGESDIYFASFFVPDFINYLLAGGYFSITLIPVLSRCFTEDKDSGWRLFSAVFWWVCIFITLLTALAFIFSPSLSQVAGPGFSEAAQERLAMFLRIILPAQMFFLPGACLTAILYLRRHFIIPALTPLIYNGAIILLGLFFINQGMIGFCWGVLLGACVGSFLLPLWGVWYGSRYETPNNAPPSDARPNHKNSVPENLTGRFALTFTLKHPELKKIVLLALPLMLGQSMVVLDEQFNRIFGSLAGEGAVSLLNYARRLMQVPIGVVAQAAGVASFPFLAHLAAMQDRQEFNATLQSAIKNVFAVLAPICAFMILTAQPLIALIYQHGDFTANFTLETALLLRLMLLGVIFWGAQQLLGRAFYACENTLTPALIGTAVTALVVPVYFVSVEYLQAKGVALTSIVGVAAYTLLLSIFWRRKHGGAALKGTVAHAWLACVCSALATLPAFGVYWLLQNFVFITSTLLLALSTLILCGLVFTPAYLLACRLIAPALLAPLAPLPRRLTRFLPTALAAPLCKLLAAPALASQPAPIQKKQAQNQGQAQVQAQDKASAEENAKE